MNNDDVLENWSKASDDCSTDSEDQEYRDLLVRSFPIQSDESDEDYICENGSSAETSESSHNENSFFEEGEIDALKEDVVSQSSWQRRLKNATINPFFFASIVDDRLKAACILKSMLNAYLIFSIFGYFDLQKRYNGREVVFETNEAKTNGDKNRKYSAHCIVSIIII